MAEIDAWLAGMEQREASDLHLKVGTRPRYRVHGDLEDVPGTEPLTNEDVDRVTREILTREEERLYLKLGKLSFGYAKVPGARFRCMYYQKAEGPGAVFRRIPTRVPSLEELDLPVSIERFTELRRGLVLVVGADGSGKTTTLAALIDRINNRHRRHVITLEEPIEYVHESRKAVIHQRGQHYDIRDFPSGIGAALEQDPDVIMLASLRRAETVRHALTAVENGVLMFATTRASGTVAAIDRIIETFEEKDRPEIRAMLSLTLAGVVTQVLLPRKDKPGRIPAIGMLVGTPEVAAAIRDGRTSEIRKIVARGKDQGMRSLDDSLETLVKEGKVDAKDAYAYARDKSKLEGYLKG